jgi:hypothetical protein
MSASSSNDCYLCGARNDPEADFCVRCDGQLLKLPTENLDIADTDPADLIIDEVSEDPIESPRKRRNRSGSVEDQRLSDALGMNEADIDPELIDPVVTSIPRATQSASIPLIGTRTGMIPQSSMHAKDLGARTYILLGLLLLATAWLGWVTLSESGVDTRPDTLAFTNSTLPVQATTTTEASRRKWTEAEAVGRYGPAFTRVLLYDCPSTTPEGATVRIEAIDDRWTAGIAIDEHNVILNESDLRSANVAVIRSRNGVRRLAIVAPGPERLRVATTDATISRHLALTETSMGDPEFHLVYDLETSVVEGLFDPSNEPLELTITDLGEVDSVRIDRATLDLPMLRAIDHEVEVVEIEDDPKPETICDRAAELMRTDIDTVQRTNNQNDQTQTDKETEVE